MFIKMCLFSMFAKVIEDYMFFITFASLFFMNSHIIIESRKYVADNIAADL